MDERRPLLPRRQANADVTQVNFTPVRKGGIDPAEVRLHLESVARTLASYDAKVHELTNEIAKLQEEVREANVVTPLPLPEVAPRSRSEEISAQATAILRQAHEEAARVTAEAQHRTAEQLIEAQERAVVVATEAEESAKRLELSAREAGERVLEAAKANGEALVSRAREQARAIVDQGNEAQRIILNDLAVKRKAMHLQIEQLRAARDTLHGIVTTVRDQVDGVLIGVQGSDEAARAAALTMLQRAPVIPDMTHQEMLEGVTLRAVPEVIESDVTETVRPRKKKSDAAKPVIDAPVASEPIAVDPSYLNGEDPTSTDVVNDIFARLRQATLDERGVTEPEPRQRAPKVINETPAGVLLERRDAALESAVSVLTRKVKRALQDDQNVMLDRLRNVTGAVTSELEDEHEQRARYASAAYDALVEAALAGSQFALSEGGANAALADFAPFHDCAADLAVTIVVALRKRIVAEGATSGVERANEVYREWRGPRVERLCIDAARRAFHLGVLAASADRNVRFVVAPSDAPCDACALDGTAAPVIAGTSFPSGSAYPPLHASCACTVVPA
jgi:cell division septum initiation protein DivIVA